MTGKILATEESTEELVKLIESYQRSIVNDKDRQIGTGMIVLKNADEALFEKVLGMRGKSFKNLGELLSNPDAEFKMEWSYLDAEINKDTKELTFSFIPKYGGYKWFMEAWYKIMYTKSSYTYTVDLEEWAYKYGKPSEFTIALHLATQAPDFVYKIATSPYTDTKVYVAQFLRQEEYDVVIDNSDVRLEDHIKDLLVDGSVIQRYIARFAAEAEGEIRGRAQAAGLIWQNGVVTGFSQDAYNREYQKGMSELNRWKAEASGCGHVLDVIAKIDEGFEYYQVPGDEVKLEWQEIPILGVDCTYHQADPVLIHKILKWWEEDNGHGVQLAQTVNVPHPYIEKVVNHWYRNQYFTREYFSKEMKNARKIAANFLYSLEEELAQKDIDVSSIVANAIAQINKVDMSSEDELVEIDITTSDDVEDNPVVSVDVSQIVSIFEGSYKTISLRFLDENQKENFDKLFKIAKDNIIYNYGLTYDMAGYPWVYHSLKDAGDPHTAADNKIKVEVNGVETEIPISVDSLTSSDYSFVTEFDRPNVLEVISRAFWHVKSTQTIVQLHNPVFEDNSKHIRNWLKEKYIIYNGETKQKDERLKEGKSYIQAKTAFDNIVAMLEKTTTDNKYIQYLKRDVVEFAQDYAFDMFQENEIQAEKNLDNIMPEYVPYTTWPSEYEKAEEPWTKMIFKKEGTTELKAPADCEIEKVEGNDIYKIAIKKSTELEENYSGMYEYIYLMADGNTTLDVDTGSYTKGAPIGSATSGESEGVNLISIKMQMLSYTKQKVDISTRMNVETKKIEDLTEEKEEICDIMGRATMYQEDEWNQEALALLNTAINRVLSPYCKDSDLKHINLDEMGISNYEVRKVKWDDIKILVDLALKGSDKTKGSTILGATRYYKLWKEPEDYGSDNNGIYDNGPYESNLENLKTSFDLSQQVGGGIFYIPNAEYKKYQDYYIDNKIRSVFIQLNEQKDELNEQKGYTAGYGKYKFKSIDGELGLVDIYADEIGEKVTKKLRSTIVMLGAISPQTNTPEGLDKLWMDSVLEDESLAQKDSIITSIIVTDVNETIEGFAEEENEDEKTVSTLENGVIQSSEDENIEDQLFTDTFRVKVNANYSVDVTITYKCVAEGEIDYNTMEYKIKSVPKL